MLTETIVIEDRVLRFEKAKSAFNSGPESGGDFVEYKAAVAEEFAALNDASYYPQVYIPFYSYGESSQQVHTFQVPHQPMVVYSPPNQVYPPISPISAPVPGSSPSESLSSSELAAEEVNKIFVGHLNGELVSQRKLLRHFQHYGHITDIELFKNHVDGRLRHEAFAFISYLKPEQMLRAIKEENGREWLGRQLKCYKALKKRDDPTAASPNVSTPIFEASENAQILTPSSP